MNPYDLDIIIVTYGSAFCIQKCLESVADACAGFSHKIHVVDNASPDDTVRAVESSSVPVTLIRNAENVGFARANNIVLRQCRGRQILLLNPDTVVHPDSVLILLETLMRGDADLAGPCLLNEDGSIQPWSGGYFPTPERAFFHYFFLAKLFSFAGHPKGFYLYDAGEAPREVDWLCGACLMMSREVLERTGLFREDFFMYGEDMDFCFRAKKLGFRISHVPPAKVTHLYRKSPRKKRSKADYQGLANLSLLVKESQGAAAGFWFDLFTAFGFSLRVIFFGIGAVFSARLRDNFQIMLALSSASWRILFHRGPWEETCD